MIFHHQWKALFSLQSNKHLAYILPVVSTWFLVGPLYVVQGIYAKHFGLALTTIAMVLMLSRLFDAISDPIIGYCSDLYLSRGGDRKSFVVIGGVLLIVAAYNLFVPFNIEIIREVKLNKESFPEISSAYFLGWFFIFYLVWTLFEVPHLAWGGELSENSQEKNLIYGYRALAINFGTLLFYLVPLAPLFDKSDYTPEKLYWVVCAGAILMVLSLYYCVKNTSNNVDKEINKDYKLNNKSRNIWLVFHEVKENKSLLYFLIAFFLSSVGFGMWFSLQFILIDSYFDLGEQFSVVNIVGLVVGGVLLSKIWVNFAAKIGKKEIWIVGILLYATAVMAAGVFKPGSDIGFLMLIMILIYSGTIAINTVAPSLMADIVDYGSWRFGIDRAATYFSLQTSIAKTTVALGGALGLGIAGWFGFDPSLDNHSPESIFGLRLAACWLPIPFLLSSIIFVTLIPINARRHLIIFRRLKKRNRRAFLTVAI